MAVSIITTKLYELESILLAAITEGDTRVIKFCKYYIYPKYVRALGNEQMHPRIKHCFQEER